MILVVGGAGYIGSHTVKELNNHNYPVLVFDNLIYGHKEAVNPRAQFTQGDLLNKSELQNLFAQYPITAVIHFAAYAYVGESVQLPQKYYQNNVIGTLNLLEAMLEHDVKKIVFSSSCATYGNPLYTPIDENHPQNPINPYGKTKLIIEQVFQDYEKAYGLQHISLRYFNAAGASINAEIGESHTPETHLIPLALKAIYDDTFSLNIFGNDYDTPDGTCIRDYIHVEDLAIAHRLALEKLGEFSGCLNLGTGTGTSIMEIIKSAEKVTGKKCKYEFSERREGDPAILFADNNMAIEILNWQPHYTDIDAIIQTAWNWEQKRKF